MRTGVFLSIFILYLLLSVPAFTQASDPVNTYCQAVSGTWAPCTGSGGTPSGPAGGDLGGTYPNPTVTNGSHITNASIPNSGLATPAPCTAFGTAVGTCAQGGVITASGPTGSATIAPIITYNAAGQLTTVSSATITPAVGSITGLGTGVATLLGGNATGTGGPVGSTSPTLTTPVLGVATATSLDGAAIGAITPSTGAFTTLAGTTLTLSSNVTMTGANSFIAGGVVGTPVNITFQSINQTGAFNSGNVTLKSGNNSQASGTNSAGPVNITAGNASGAGSTGNGGNVVVTAGTSVGGTAGNIQLASQTSVTNATDATSTATGSLQVAGGGVVTKRFWIPGITASAGLQTAVLCQSSGGEMIADSVACLASGRQFKNIIGPMSDGALTKLVKLPIDRWQYKAEGQFTSPGWTRERIGPIAQDVAAMDSHLAGYDEAGNVRTYSTEQLLAFTIKAVQEFKGEFDQYRREHP